jgi:hypothetical protein
MPTTYEPIATTTLGSAASSITFSSIAGTYTDLRLVFAGFNGSDLKLRFNSDTGANYSQTVLNGDGSSASSYRNSSIFLNASGTTGTSSQPVLYTADVFSYAGSTFKTVLSDEQFDKNGSGAVTKNVGLWRSTSAITSIDIVASTASTIYVGTTATLYGIKNA